MMKTPTNNNHNTTTTPTTTNQRPQPQSSPQPKLLQSWKGKVLILFVLLALGNLVRRDILLTSAATTTTLTTTLRTAATSLYYDRTTTTIYSSNSTATTTATTATTTTTNTTKIKFEACVITSSFATDIRSMDKIWDVSQYVHKDTTIKFYLFSNLKLDNSIKGWENVQLKDSDDTVVNISSYKRMITKSRWPKFMAWLHPTIRNGCQSCFYLDASSRLRVPRAKKRSKYGKIDFLQMLHGTKRRLFASQNANGAHDANNNNRSIDRIGDGIGFAIPKHPDRETIYEEFMAIQDKNKDTSYNVNQSITWMKQTDETCFKTAPVYQNQYFMYLPTNKKWQTLTKDCFWKRYSLEVDSWRDQPLLSFCLKHLNYTPVQMRPRHFEMDDKASGHNGHQYVLPVPVQKDDENDKNDTPVVNVVNPKPLTKKMKPYNTLMFIAETPRFGSVTMRGRQFIAEWNKTRSGTTTASILDNKNTSSQAPSLLTTPPSFWKYGIKRCKLKKLCADVCIFIGPCSNGYPSRDCCRVRLLDVIDKYLYAKDRIDHSLHEFDALIVNNNYMKDYFQQEPHNYQGDIKVLYHHSDPRWDNVTTATTTDPTQQLRFGYIGSIPSLRHTENFLHHDELTTDKNKDKYSIFYVDTDQGEVPSTVNFNCDLSIRPINTPVSRFKTTAKIATAAALGHNIITTLDEAVKDMLPTDYPFILRAGQSSGNDNDSDSSNGSSSMVLVETITEMMDQMIQDYASVEQTLWKKGLEQMKDVNKKLSLSSIAAEYHDYISNIYHSKFPT